TCSYRNSNKINARCTSCTSRQGSRISCWLLVKGELGELVAEVFRLRRTRHAKRFTAAAPGGATRACQMKAAVRASGRVVEFAARFAFDLGFPDNWQPTTGNCLNSLLIPCFGTLKSRNPPIHAAFLEWRKKFPVFFPVIGNFMPI